MVGGAQQARPSVGARRGHLPARGVEGGEEEVRGAARLQKLESRSYGGCERWEAREGARSHVHHCRLSERAKGLVGRLNDDIGALEQGAAREARKCRRRAAVAARAGSWERCSLR